MVPQPNPPSKHHYIPEFHLKQWTSDDGRLERFTNPHSNKITVRRVPPSEAAWAHDLYRSPEKDPDRHQHLELEFFQVVDSAAAGVLRKLVEPEPKLTPDERAWWAVYIMALLHRTPDNLDAYKAGGQRVLDDVLAELEQKYEANRGPNDPPTYEEYIASRTATDDERSLMGVLPQVIVNGNSGQFIADMAWRIMDVSGASHRLLISDYPVVRSNGLLIPNGHLAMPLSPTKLFVTAPERATFDLIDRMPVSDLVRNTNREIVGCARRFVGATDRRQERFIRNRFGKLLGLRLGEPSNT